MCQFPYTNAFAPLTPAGDRLHSAPSWHIPHLAAAVAIHPLAAMPLLRQSSTCSGVSAEDGWHGGSPGPLASPLVCGISTPPRQARPPALDLCRADSSWEALLMAADACMLGAAGQPGAGSGR